MYDGIYVYRDKELYHFGIPGMKWGVRKAVESSGFRRRSKQTDYSRTPKPKSKHRSNLEAKYMTKGMSEKDAKKAAEKKNSY